MWEEGYLSSVQWSILNGEPSAVPIDKQVEGYRGHHRCALAAYLLYLEDCKEEAKQAALRSSLKYTEDFTQTLPNELLSLIFSFVCFGSIDPANLAMPSYHRHIGVESGRLLVCQISRRWREIALSTPSIWASICVMDKTNLRLVQLWLERSCRYPLSVTVEMRDRWSNNEVENLQRTQHFNDATSLLLTEKCRWQHFFFKVVECHPAIEFLANADIASIITLESASLILLKTQGKEGNIEKQVLGAVSSLPRLRQFAWKSYKGLPSSVTSSVWSRLTDISLGTPISTDDCVRFLGSCHSASSVAIREIHHDYGDDFEWRTGQPTLPFLQSLYLAETKGDMTVVLDHFTMPSLQHLRICTAIKDGGVGRLDRFLVRSACSLECFVMRGWRMSEETMSTYLQIPAMRNVGWVRFKPLITSPYGYDTEAVTLPGVAQGELCYHTRPLAIVNMKR